jgi:hypothetical protein
MININEYILTPLTERQAHLKLDEPCTNRGGYPGLVSQYLKGLLAHTLDTTIPLGHKIFVCHACYNADCSNPYHIYWGTPKENRADGKANGQKSIWEYMVDKYGLEKAKQMNKRSYEHYSRAGANNKGKEKSEKQKQKISNTVTLLHREGVYNKVKLGRKKKDFVGSNPT